MVKKGLTAGDIFTDGGRKFRVISVLENGDYISEAVKGGGNSNDKPEEPGSGNSDGKSEEPDGENIDGKTEDPNSENGETKIEDPDNENSSGKYTKRQIQRMQKAEIMQLALELGLETTGKTTETREAVLKKLGF